MSYNKQQNISVTIMRHFKLFLNYQLSRKMGNCLYSYSACKADVGLCKYLTQSDYCPKTVIRTWQCKGKINTENVVMKSPIQGHSEKKDLGPVVQS